MQMTLSSTLQTVEHYTYLGTTLDHKLSGEQQVKKVTQTANCRLTTLAKIRKNIDTKTTNLLCYLQFHNIPKNYNAYRTELSE